MSVWTPTWRMIWCVGSTVSTALFVGIDWLLRDAIGQTGLAPTASLLWLSVGCGMAVGLAGMLWEGYLLRNKREFLLAFHRTQLAERLAWKFQGTNLLLNGWFILAILALIGWCYSAEVFVLPALCALNAVLFMGNQRATQEFNAELHGGASKLGGQM